MIVPGIAFSFCCAAGQVTSFCQLLCKNCKTRAFTEETRPKADSTRATGIIPHSRALSQAGSEEPARVRRKIAGNAYAPAKSPSDAIMAATCMGGGSSLQCKLDAWKARRTPCQITAALKVPQSFGPSFSLIGGRSPKIIILTVQSCRLQGCWVSHDIYAQELTAHCNTLAFHTALAFHQALAADRGKEWKSCSHRKRYDNAEHTDGAPQQPAWILCRSFRPVAAGT